MLTIALLTKNSEDTVKYTLNSLYTQKIPSSLTFELVVVDGYSTDNTIKVVNNGINKIREKFRNQFVRYVILQERVGVGYARNLALRESYGEWILWVDSDNILAQDYILQAIKKIEHQNIAVLYPGRVVPIRKERNLASRLILCYHISQSSPYQGEKRLKRLIKREPIHEILPYTAMQGTMCNVKVLRNIGGFNPYLNAAEDLDLFFRVISNKYRMEPFNSTLYSFCRDRLNEWFKQAVMWGYGKEVMRMLNRPKTTLTLTPSETKGLTKVSEKIRGLMIHNLAMIFLLSKKTMHLCGIMEALCMPLMYIYRRVGYIKGYLYALDQRRKITRILSEASFK
jgi:glycosyltransferase involved in cell wall biosynthesis